VERQVGEEHAGHEQWLDPCEHDRQREEDRERAEERDDRDGHLPAALAGVHGGAAEAIVELGRLERGQVHLGRHVQDAVLDLPLDERGEQDLPLDEHRRRHRHHRGREGQAHELRGEVPEALPQPVLHHSLDHGPPDRELQRHPHAGERLEDRAAQQLSGRGPPGEARGAGQQTRQLGGAHPRRDRGGAVAAPVVTGLGIEQAQRLPHVTLASSHRPRVCTLLLVSESHGRRQR
jgi:hypothetical protein